MKPKKNPRLIPLEKIWADETTGQVRVEMSEEHVQNLLEALESGAQLPPIDVFVTPYQWDHQSQDYQLADGHHRVEAARRRGDNVILAKLTKGYPSDAFRFALGCNTAHGLPRNRADKRRAVELALKKWPKSDREIGDICGRIDHKTVGRVRRELEATGEIPRLEFRTGADGRTRKMPCPPVLSDAEWRKRQMLRQLREALKAAPPASERKPERITIQVKHGENTSSEPIDNTIEAITEAINRWERLPTDSGRARGIPAGAVRASEKALQHCAPKYDRLGRQIPKTVHPLWQKAEELGEMASELRRVASCVNAQEENEALFHEVNFTGLVAALKQASSMLKRVTPYALCPTCQGMTPDKCLRCGGRGFISEHAWNNDVSQETKAMIQKNNQRNPKAKSV